MTLSSLHGLGGLERLGVGREHDLRDAVVIAQVDEQQIAVVALAMDPAGDTDVLADVLGTQLVVCVRAIPVCRLRSRVFSRVFASALALSPILTLARTRRSRYALARASRLVHLNERAASPGHRLFRFRRHVAHRHGACRDFVARRESR